MVNKNALGIRFDKYFGIVRTLAQVMQNYETIPDTLLVYPPIISTIDSGQWPVLPSSLAASFTAFFDKAVSDSP